MMIARISLFAAATAILLNVAGGFSTAPILGTGGVSTATVGSTTTTSSRSSTALQMANDDDLLRWAKSSRTAGVDDTVVELKRPIGVVLAEDDNGNVYVETVAPNGNAARSGKVMCSSLNI